MPLDKELFELASQSTSSLETGQRGGLDVGLFSEAYEAISRKASRPPRELTGAQKEELEIYQKEQARLAHARSELEESPLPGFKAYGVAAGAPLVALGARIGGQDEFADRMIRTANAIEQAQREREAGGVIPDILQRDIRGAGASLTSMSGAGMIAGPAGAIGLAAAQESNRAITEGRDAGLGGNELAGYAVTQGVIEGLPATIMQRMGLGGTESLVAGKSVVSAGLKEGLKRLGISAAQELPEELITELGHNVAAKLSGVDPEATSKESLRQTVADTTVQTFIAVAIGGSPSLARSIGTGKAADVGQEIMDYTAKRKTPSRRTWRRWGFSRESAESGPERRAETQRLAGLFQAVQSDRLSRLSRQAPEAPETPTGALVAETAQEPGLVPEPTREAPGKPEQLLEATEPAAVQPAPGEPAVVPAKKLEEALPREVPSAEVDVAEIERRGPAGDFIRDTKGRVGISISAMKKGAEKGKNLLGRFLTSKGELPQSVFESKVSRDSAVSKIQKEVAFNTKAYNRAVKQAYGSGVLPTKVVAQIDSALRGQASMESLPGPLQEPLAVMRQHIDALSRRLIEIGAVQGELAATVAGNLGVYLTRSYEAFDSPKWAERVPVAVRNRATSLLRSEYPDRSEAEIQGLIEALLYEGKAAESPIALFKSSKLGEKDLSILTRRKDIPPEIRALLGEYKDPRLNYARSVTRIGELIANQQFLSEARTAGTGTFFSETPTLSSLGELKTRIAVEGNSTLAPLNGLYTTPEIKQAFERAVQKEHLPNWARVYLGVNSAVKLSKTVLSAMTQVRNIIANIGFAVANGHWRIGKAKTAWKGTLTGLLNLNGQQWRDYYLRAVELGIVNEDVHSGELKDIVKDASTIDLDDFYSSERQRAKATTKVARRALKTATDIYRAGDDIWKLYAWENEKARYRNALPELSETEIEKLTARIVRNTYPTYSMVPEAVRKLRRFPLVGTFVSFPAEVVRTSYHTLEQAKNELQDSRLRKIGATRLAGFTAAMAGTSAAAIALRMLVGISRDDDEDMRHFVPPWQTNSQFLHFGRTPNGDFRYVDLAYSDPHSLLKDPFRAFLRGEDFKTKLWGGFKEFAEPFASEEILFQAFSEVWRNKKGKGGQVYNPQESVDKQTRDVIAHFGKAIEPGTVTSLKRIKKGITKEKTDYGRSYDTTAEAIAMITGQRVQDLDVRQSLKYRASNFRHGLSDSDRVFRQVMYRRGSVGDGELIEAYRAVDERRKRLFQEASEIASAAIRLGIEPREVRSIFASSGLTGKQAVAVLRGKHIPYRITQVRLKSMREAAPEEYKDRFRALVTAVRSTMKQQKDSARGT
jgi:broad specificity phosphatase PhoE